jgi:Regulator of Chromosome Condensation (RCC1) repeat protein
MLLAGCNDPPAAPVPPGLVSVQAPSPVGVPGWALLDTLKVRAVDANGAPQPGVAVTWTVREGGGSIAPIGDATDTEGLAAAVWTLGDQAGPNTVRASTLEGAFVDFESSGEAFRVDRLASSIYMGCGLVSGAIWCWGEGFWVNGAPVSNMPRFGSFNLGPALVDNSRAFLDLAVGGNSICAVDDQLAVWCANGSFPQLMRVDGLPPVQGIVGASLNSSYCATALSDSTAWCWQFGGLPAQVPASPAFTALSLELAGFSSGDVLVCGLRTDSTAACWGPSPLGDGTTDSSDTPVPVAGGHRFVEIAVGESFACGRTSDGSVWCWGKDYDYQLPPVPDILTPVLAVTGASRIVAGWDDAQLLSAISGIGRWRGAGFDGPTPLIGLEGLPVDRFANDDPYCVQLADDQVYCTEELFNNSTQVLYDYYAPVQPVRPAPAEAHRR